MKKETLEKEYVTNGLTQKQIAEKYNISRKNVIYLMQSYNMKVRPKHSMPDEELSLQEEDFIFGKLLGDGSIYKGESSINHRLGFAHGEKQKEYIEYCHSFISKWCNNPPVYREQQRDPKIYSTPVLKKYVLETISHPEFSRIHRYFYEYGKKIVNNSILNSLTPFSIAIWFMDDGSLEVDHRTNSANGAKIATNCFPLESVQLICKWFKITHNINCNPNKAQIGKDGISQYCVRISKSSLKDFCNLIRPYVIDSMKYKIIS